MKQGLSLISRLLFNMVIVFVGSIGCLTACYRTIQTEQVIPGLDYKQSGYLPFSDQTRHSSSGYRDVIWREAGIAWRYWQKYHVNRGGTSSIILFNINHPQQIAIFVDAASQDPIALELSERIRMWEKSLGRRQVGEIRGIKVKFSSGEGLSSEPWVNKDHFVFDMPGLSPNFKILFAGKPMWSAYVGEFEVLGRSFRFMIASMSSTRDAGTMAALIFRTLNPLKPAIDEYLQKTRSGFASEEQK